MKATQILLCQWHQTMAVFFSIETVTTEARVSLFGFGPYPEIPPDYPNQNIWDYIENLSADDARLAENVELMARVRIALWNQGLRTRGAKLNSRNGFVYPIYPNTVYVKWDEVVLEDGTVARVATNVVGDAALQKYFRDLHDGIIPPGVTIIEMAKGGIEPYQFLNLHER